MLKSLAAPIAAGVKLKATLKEKIDIDYFSNNDILEVIEKLQKEMREAAEKLDFEKAAQLRDQIKKIEELIENESNENGFW